MTKEEQKYIDENKSYIDLTFDMTIRLIDTAFRENFESIFTQDFVKYTYEMASSTTIKLIWSIGNAQITTNPFDVTFDHPNIDLLTSALYKYTQIRLNEYLNKISRL